MTTVNLNAAYFPVIEFISAVATVTVLLYGGNQVIDGAIKIGVLVGFLAALNNFFDPITQLSQLYTTYQSGMGGARQDLRAAGRAAGDARARRRRDARANPRRPALRARQLRLTAVPDGELDRLALDDVDLAIAPGETVALVGATGAGKSTFAKLVARFLRPDSRQGRDRRPGRARRHLRVAALAVGHRSPGGVPVLGHGGLEHRVRRARRERRRDRAAARAVGAHEFIASLEDGYATQVGERGGQLSAGQRQAGSRSPAR